MTGTVHPRLRAVAGELVGVLAAAVIAIVTVWHATASARSNFLYFNPDSVVLPILMKSVQADGAAHFVTSSPLFVPEFLLYALCAAVTPTVYAAIALNAVLNVLALYGLARASAPRTLLRWVRIALALVAVAIFAALTLLETGADRFDLELFSQSLTGAYYSSVLLGTGFVLLLLVRSLARPGWGALVGIGVIAAFVTFSNPLFFAWGVAPGVVLVGLVFIVRRGRSVGDLSAEPVAGGRLFRLLRATAPALVLVAGAVIGYDLRIPFGAHLAGLAHSYLNLFGFGSVWEWLGHALGANAALGAPGWLVILVPLAFLGVLVAVAVQTRGEWRSGLRSRSTLIVLGLVITAFGLSIGYVLTGQIAVRYLQPVAVLPIIMLPGWLRLPVRLRARLRVVASAVVRLFSRRVAAIAGVVALVVAGGLTGMAAAASVSALTTPSLACLQTWVDGRPIVGAGNFGDTRAIKSVDSPLLLQIYPDFEVYPWMIDLDEYRGAQVSYLVVNTNQYDIFGAQLGTADFYRVTVGTPAAITQCPDFQIWDYAGTPDEQKINDLIQASFQQQLAVRGWN